MCDFSVSCLSLKEDSEYFSKSDDLSKCFRWLEHLKGWKWESTSLPISPSTTICTYYDLDMSWPQRTQGPFVILTFQFDTGSEWRHKDSQDKTYNIDSRTQAGPSLINIANSPGLVTVMRVVPVFSQDPQLDYNSSEGRQHIVLRDILQRHPYSPYDSEIQLFPKWLKMW